VFLSTWHFGPSWPLSRFKNCDFQSVFGRSASALRPSKKVNRKLTTSFPMSLRWTAYVALKPPKGAQRRILTIFPSKSVLSKKVCCKVSLCENFQPQSCKAFTGLSSRTQMVGGGCPFLPEILDQSDPPISKTAIYQSIFVRTSSTVKPKQLNCH